MSTTKKKLGIFGIVESKITKGTFELEGTADVIEEKVTRESGLSKLIYNNTMFAEALKDPGVFLTNKTADLKRIGKILSQLYFDEYKRGFQLGMKEKELEKMAKTRVEEERVRQMKIHEENFPTTLRDAILKKQDKTFDKI